VSSLLDRLPDKRWFGHKGRTVAGIAMVDEAIVEDGPPALVLGIARVTFTDGPSALYQIPLLVHEDGTADEAESDLDRLRVLGDLMVHGSSIKGSSGVFQFGGPGLDPLAPPPGEASIRLIGAEQSNTSLVLDETVIFKLFRQLAIGPNPDLELNRLLTNEGFAHVPSQVGEAIYEGEVDGADVSIDLGVAQRFIPDGIDGWEEALARVNGLYDEVDDADAAEDRVALTEERTGEFLHAIEQLGDATASLHVLLAREEIEHDLMPEPVDEHDLLDWAATLSLSFGRVVRGLPDELAGLETALDARLDDFREIADAGVKTRVHGDFHLGQVLATPRGWMMLDFEGEPARPLSERRRKQSPLRDVAGMLRSFGYAASAALMQRATSGTDEWARLEPWAHAWEELARERFLSAYLTRAHEGRFLPSDRGDLLTMVDVFEIDKAIYEIGYEQNHRPDWAHIPIRGLSRALNGNGSPA
jgi:trehalose synthase-fused probable maltokinase